LERRDPATAEALLRALRENETSYSRSQYHRVRLLDALGSLDDAHLAEFLRAPDFGILRAALELAPGRVPPGSEAQAGAFGKKLS
jgi:hypothetical protein